MIVLLLFAEHIKNDLALYCHAHTSTDNSTIRYYITALEVVSSLALFSSDLFAILFPIITYLRREVVWWLTIPVFILGLKLSEFAIVSSWYAVFAIISEYR